MFLIGQSIKYMAKKKEMRLYKRHDNPNHPGLHAHQQGLDAAITEFEDFLNQGGGEISPNLAIAPEVWSGLDRARRRS